MFSFNIKHLHFFEYTGNDFLIFPDSKIHSKDLKSIGYLVNYVNKEKKPISDFELGQVFVGYRFVYPIFFDDKYVGAIEFSETIAKKIEEIFNQQTRFIILKNAVEEKEYRGEISKNYSSWFANSSYLINNKFETLRGLTEKDLGRIRETLAEFQEKDEPFYIEIKINSKPAIMVFLPITNYIGEKVAYIYTVFSGNDIWNYDENFYHVSSLMFLLLYYGYSSKKMEKLSTFDSLTNVYIRRVIMALIENELERYKRYKEPFSIVMIDVDHFKNINDTYGYQTGDVI